MEIINSLEDLVPKYYSSFELIDWKNLCLLFHLSDEFIEQYKDKLDWSKLSMRHKLSRDFIEKFSNKIDWESIIFNPGFTYDYMVEFIDKISKNSIYNYVRFNMGKIDKFSELELLKKLLNQ